MTGRMLSERPAGWVGMRSNWGGNFRRPPLALPDSVTDRGCGRGIGLAANFTIFA